MLTSMMVRRSASVARELPDIEYILEAVISVNLEAWAEFDREYGGKGAQKLVEVFHRAGLELAYSSANLTDATIEFINYWRIGSDANDLARAEIKMLDNTIFAQFDKVVQRDETKSMLCEMKAVAPARIPGLDPANVQYLRILYDVEPRGLEEFMAQLESHVAPFGRDREWALGKAHLYHLGRDGRVVQLWLVPRSSSIGECRKQIAKMPWLRSIRGEPLLRAGTAPEPTLHHLTDFDPHKTGSHKTGSHKTGSHETGERA